MRSALRAEPQTEHRVLETPDLFLVEHAPAPVIAVAEGRLSVGGIPAPATANFTEEFHGIRIGQFMFQTDRGIEGAVEQETRIQGEKIVTAAGMCRKGGQQETEGKKDLSHTLICFG